MEIALALEMDFGLLTYFEWNVPDAGDPVRLAGRDEFDDRIEGCGVRFWCLGLCLRLCLCVCLGWR